VFLFRLALALGKSIREVEALGASELEEWMLFWKMDPWGSYRDNIHAGLIAATLANIHRSKNSRAITHEDFMLVDHSDYQKKKTRETLTWMKAVAKRKK